MKTINDIQAYVANIPDNDHAIFSNTEGAKNLLFYNDGAKTNVKSWIGNGFNAELMVLAHGFKSKGEIAIVGKDFPARVIGRGKADGTALFIQFVDEVFTIVYCSDKSRHHVRFAIAATRSADLIKIILTLAGTSIVAPEDTAKIVAFIGSEENENEQAID